MPNVPKGGENLKNVNNNKNVRVNFSRLISVNFGILTKQQNKRN